MPIPLRTHRLRPAQVAAFASIVLLQAALEAADAFEAPVDRAFVADFDGTEQKYVELRPVGLDPQAPVDVLIALHGHGADRWQYVREERGECKAVRDVAARHRMVMVSPDYRAKTSWMGPAAEADVVQLIANLHSRFQVRRVYLAGASMGGASALIFAALHPDLIDGVVSENGTANMIEYDQFQDAITASYGTPRQEQSVEHRKRSPELVPEKLTMPLALTVGGRDSVVPPASVRRLAQKLADRKHEHVLLLDDMEGGHATSYDDTVTALEFVIRSAESIAAAR